MKLSLRLGVIASGLYTISKGFGLLRIVAIAYFLGAGWEVGAFYVAEGVTFCILSVITSVIQYSVLPVYSAALHTEDKTEANRFASSSLTALVLIVLAASAIVISFAPAIVAAVAPGFEPEQQATVLSILRAFIWYVLLLSVAEFFRSVICAHKSVTFPALAPIANTVAILISLIMFHSRAGVWALVGGYLAGATLQAVILGINAFWVGFRYSPMLELRSVLGRKLLHLALWVTLAKALNALLRPLDMAMLSGLEDEAIACLRYVQDLLGPLFQVFQLTFASVALAFLSDQFASSRQEEFRDTLNEYIRGLLLVLVPATVFLWIASSEVVRLVLGHGKFRAGGAAEELAAAMFRMYALSIVPTVLWNLIGISFLAAQKPHFNFIIPVFELGAKYGANWLLRHLLGAPGVALAAAVVMLLNMAIGLLMLRTFLVRPIIWSRVGADLLLAMGAAAPAGATAWVIRRAIQPWTTSQGISPLVIEFSAMLCGFAIVYLLLSWRRYGPQLRQVIKAILTQKSGAENESAR